MAKIKDSNLDPSLYHENTGFSEQDGLIVFNRCGGNACYVKPTTGLYTQKVLTRHCYGCGFTTNCLMKRGEKFLEEQMEKLPNLYKELLGEDEEGLIWMPSTVNIVQKGMVFANGKSKDDWEWSAVKAIPVTEEEKEKYPIPGKEGEYYKWRMDMETIETFSQTDYMDALEYIGIFNNE